MNDEAVYRIAPATPGLLNIMNNLLTYIYSIVVNLVNTKVCYSCSDVRNKLICDCTLTYSPKVLDCRRIRVRAYQGNK